MTQDAYNSLALAQLQTVLLGLDRQRLTAMATLLGRAGIPVLVHTSADSALEAVERQRASLLLVDSMIRPPDTVVARAQLLVLHHRPRCTVLIDPPQGVDTGRWVADLAERGLRAQVIKLGSPYSILEALLPLLSWNGAASDETAPAASGSTASSQASSGQASSSPPARTANTQSYSPPAPTQAPPEPITKADVDGVCFVANLWARRHSGILTTRNGRATLVGGQPADAASRDVVIEAMQEGGASFSSSEPEGQRIGLNLGPQLWAAVETLADPSLVMQRGEHILVERSMASRAREMPLPPALRRMLGALRPGLSVRALALSVGQNLEQVAGPLSALVRAGFYQLRPAPNEPRLTPVAASPRVAAQASPRSSTTVGPTDFSDPSLGERLRREWARVEDADDWTALGVAAASPPELITRALVRLEHRYGELQEHATDPEVRALAARLITRARSAAANVRSGKPWAGRTETSQAESAFLQGKKAMDREDWGMAVRWFNAAREMEPQSALYTGYLGWALFNGHHTDAARRKAKGRELLELADATAEPIPELQCFLVIVEAESGEFDNALSRAERTLKQFPTHGPAQALVERLRRDLRAKGR